MKERKQFFILLTAINVVMVLIAIKMFLVFEIILGAATTVFSVKGLLDIYSDKDAGSKKYMARLVTATTYVVTMTILQIIVGDAIAVLTACVLAVLVGKWFVEGPMQNL